MYIINTLWQVLATPFATELKFFTDVETIAQGSVGLTTPEGA